MEKEKDEVKLALRRLTTENIELKEKLLEAEERWAERFIQDEALSKHFENKSQALEKDKKKLQAEIEELTAKVEEKWIETSKRDRTDDAQVDSLEKRLLEVGNESQALKEDKRRMEAEIEELTAKLNDAMEAAEQADVNLDAYQQLVCNLDIEKKELIEKLNQYQQGNNSTSQLMEKICQNGEKFKAEIKNLKDEVNMLTSVSEHDQAALFNLEEHSQNWLEERERLIEALAKWDENWRIWKEEKKNLLEEKEKLVGELAELEENRKKLKIENDNLLEEKDDLLLKIDELDKQQEMFEARLVASQSWYVSYFSKAIEHTEASLKWIAEKKLLESDLCNARKDMEYYKTLLLEYQAKCFELKEETKDLAEELKLKTEDCERLADEYKETCGKLQNDNDGLRQQLVEAMERCDIYRSLLRGQDSCPKFA